MKKRCLIIITLIIGLLAAVFLFLSENYDRELKDGNRILKNSEGEGDSEILVDAKIEGFKKAEQLMLSVPEREYSQEEITILEKNCQEELTGMILGSNADLLHVESDLVLPNKVEGYPFKIRWKSSDEEVLGNAGKINCPLGCTEEHEVLLVATIVYKEYSEKVEIPVRVVPVSLSLEETVRLKLRLAAQSAATESGESSEVILPEKIDEREISWEKSYSYTGVIVLGATIFLAVLIGIAADYDEQKKVKEKEERLQRVYPVFTERLRMYLLSGLSMKNAFLQMEKSLRKSGQKKYAELLIVLSKIGNELKNGIAQEKAFEKIGSECRGEYKRLSFLITVNLKRGNDQILKLLEEENKKAMEGFREKTFEQADKAGIKLLFPMMIMLIVVMIMIMCPAYFEMN